MPQSEEDSEGSQDDMILFDDIIDEKANNNDNTTPEDNLFGPSVGDFIKSRKSNKKKKSTPRSHIAQKLPDNLSGLYTEAQKCYIIQDFNRAKLLLSELTKNIPEYAGIYNLLGLIYENENNITNACDSYFIAAEILKKDSSKWMQTYELSCKLGLEKRQLYCLTRLIRLQPDDASLYDKRYKLYIKNEQYAKAAVDILSLCRITHDCIVHIPEAYSICHKAGKEADLLQYLQSQHSQVLSQLKALSNQLDGVTQTSLTPEVLRSRLDQILNTWTIIAQLYLNIKDYTQALNTIDIVNSICSIPLPVDMAVIYSVSLLHVGRIDDALEIIDSLLIIENFSEEEAEHSFTLASALQECHMIDKALEFIQLLLSLPSYQNSDTFYLSYLCYNEKKDIDHCIEDLTKALDLIPEGMNEKKQELALKLSKLYDEKGELLKSVEITTKYLSKARHFVNRNKQQYNKQEYHQAVSKLWTLLGTLPAVQLDLPSIDDRLLYISIVDPLICNSCLLSPPSSYYDKIQPNEEANEIGKIIDIPAVLGQAMFLELIWQNTFYHVSLGGFSYVSEYLRVIRSTFKFATVAYQNTLLLLCSIHSFKDTRVAAESLRTLMINTLTGDGSSSVFAVLETKQEKEGDSIQYPNEEATNQTQLKEGQIVSLNNQLVFHIYSLSLNTLISYLSLLLPATDYSFSTNLFKQLQRQKVVHDSVLLLLGQIALYRNPSSCRQFFTVIQEAKKNALISLSLGVSNLTLSNSRTNPDKRLTLLEAFTEIQNYAISREEYINEHNIPSIHDMKEGNKENGLYTISTTLPKELYQMEVLYNLGRAFHQISLVHIAVMYYQKVLEIADQCRDIPEDLKKTWNMYSLEKAASYNLCILLKASGSNVLAQHIRKRYLCFE